MTRYAVFVDLSNFYSSLIREVRSLKKTLANDIEIRNYFLYGLELDFLAQHLSQSFQSPSIWVFYSSRKIGPRNLKIENNDLQSYIKRINSFKGVTSIDVNIPNSQRENFECPSCGQSSESLSEKGVDSSLTVHMIDTMNTWDVAYLLSGDADFVPVVSYLRRNGKVVIGAGFSNPAPDLVRVCYEYVNLWQSYIKESFVTYLLFKSVNALLKKWLTERITLGSHGQPYQLTAKVNPHNEIDSFYFLSLDEAKRKDRETRVRIIYSQGLGVEEIKERIKEFYQEFPENIDRITSESIILALAPYTLQSINIYWPSFTYELKSIYNNYKIIEDELLLVISAN